jgi:hypothetical protein
MRKEKVYRLWRENVEGRGLNPVFKSTPRLYCYDDIRMALFWILLKIVFHLYLSDVYIELRNNK